MSKILKITAITFGESDDVVIVQEIKKNKNHRNGGASSLALNTSRIRANTTSMGNLLQLLNIPSVKMFMFQLIIKLDYKILSLNFNTNLEEMKKKKVTLHAKNHQSSKRFSLETQTR